MLSLVTLVLVLAGCGGDNGFSVFASAETISVESSADVEVIQRIPVRINSVLPIPPSLTVPRGGVAVLSATSRDAEDRVLTGLRYTWRMRDPAAGTVSASGVFTAGSVPGTYSNAIEVEAAQAVEGREFTAVGRASVVVTSGFFDTTIESVIIFPRTSAGRPGDYVPLRAAAIGDSGGLVQDVDFFWRVTDPNVGTIDQMGGLTLGSRPGDYFNAVEVQARRLGGSGAPVLGNSTVRIISAAEAAGGVRAIIGPSAVLARPGTRVPLVLLTVDHNGRPVASGQVEWKVIDQAAGTVSANGVLVLGDTPGVYPEAIEGEAALVGEFAGQSVTARLDVMVQPPQSSDPTLVAGVTQVFPQTVRLAPHETMQLSVLTYDANGIPRTVRDAEWSYDAGLFGVDARGRLTTTAGPGVYPDALAATVQGPDGNPTTASKSVTVLGPLARVSVTPGRATVEGGQAVQFLAEAHDAAGSRLYDVRFRWSLADGAPGKLSQGGLYVAEARPGLFEGVVKVVATQLVPD